MQKKPTYGDHKTVWIRKSTHQALKIEAARRGVLMSTMVDRILRQALAEADGVAAERKCE